jgi:hypothetical protein
MQPLSEPAAEADTNVAVAGLQLASSWKPGTFSGDAAH